MKSKIIFGRWEAIAFILNLLITQVILGFPRSMVETGKTAGWMIPIYATGIILICFAVISRLYSPFEGKDILEIAEETGGDILRIVIGLLFLIYLVFIISVVLREFAEDMKVVALPASPISFVTMFFLVGMIVGAYAGLEALVRCNSYIVPIIIGGLLVIIIGCVPFFNAYNLMPVLGSGIPNIFGRGFLKISMFSALSILFFIAPYIKTKKNFRSVGYISIAIAGFLFTLTTAAYLLVYPFPVALERFLPVYNLARLINFGRFFQRIESIFVLIWAASALLYLSGGFFLILHVFRKTFKLDYYKPLIIPMSILIFTISLLPPNLLSAVELEQRYFRNYIWILTFVIPIILLLFAGWIKKSRKKEGIKK
jgi:spore germination protein (amino acid permease)